MDIQEPKIEKINLLDFDEKKLRRFFELLEEAPFRATQVLKWIHQRGVIDFSMMTDLSYALRERLTKVAVVTIPEIAKEQVSVDGTIKWLLDVGNNNCVETVYIPEETRGTLCISSQIGCALNCSFCATGKQGFNRNLKASEIIGQLWQAKKRLAGKSITNVVLMGMGEPLLNFEPVATALSIMRDDNAYGLAKRRVTVSTSGVVPGIEKLKEHCDVALAISLHAPNDELRNTLMPINKKYDLKQLMKACKEYLPDTKRDKITIEYIMLKGLNDTTKHARELVKLLEGLSCKVNLIPFNSVDGIEFVCSDSEDILKFASILQKSGIVTTQRKTRGGDIDAACGQLAGDFKDRTKRKERLQNEARS